MNFFLLYLPDDEKDVQEKVLPLFEGHQISPIEFPESGQLEHLQKKSHLCICWLPDEPLKKVLTSALDGPCRVACLPHPQAKKLIKSLGITGELEEVVEGIKTTEEASRVELLFCNDRPVFHSVRTGSIFDWEYGARNYHLLKKLKYFFRALFSSYSLLNSPYSLQAGEEKLIDTAGIGVLAIEHAGHSLLSKQWISDEDAVDGQFHLFVVSPQNIVDLIRYLFRNMISAKNSTPFKPDFIGHIRSDELSLTGSGSVRYMLDDQEYEEERLELQIRPDVLHIWQPSEYAGVEKKEEIKKTVRLKGLPTGERRTAIIGRSIPWLPRATAEEFSDLFKLIREQAATTNPYLIMMWLSILIATFGLYGNSSPVIIGAMILAPLMGPIVSFSMGVVRYDISLMSRSIRTIGMGTMIGLIVAIGVSWLIPIQILTSEMQARLSPNLLDLGIATASGIAAAYAQSRESIAQSLAGVAIAVALVPPLAVSGIGIGWLDWEIFSGAFLLYMTNLGGIILCAGLTFVALGFTPFQRAGKGLLYTLLIVIGLGVPLSFSFHRMQEEARITQLLEGYKMENITIRDVKVRYGKPPLVIVKLVTNKPVAEEAYHEIRDELTRRVNTPIKVQVITAIEL